jgi:hypothetical protein
VVSGPTTRFKDELSFCPARLRQINSAKAKEVYFSILFPMFFIRKNIQMVIIIRAHNGKSIK